MLFRHQIIPAFAHLIEQDERVKVERIGAMKPFDESITERRIGQRQLGSRLDAVLINLERKCFATLFIVRYSCREITTHDVRIPELD